MSKIFSYALFIRNHRNHNYCVTSFDITSFTSNKPIDGTLGIALDKLFISSLIVTQGLLERNLRSFFSFKWRVIPSI